MGKYWKPGFTGATVDKMVDFIVKTVGDSTRVCVPFFGSGKEVAALTRENRTIVSTDQQYLSDIVARAVFQAEEGPENITEPKFLKGYVYNERPFKDIDQHSAALIDYISEYATEYERVALSTAVVRGTYLGLLHMWGKTITFRNVWSTFYNKRLKNREWLNRPGTLIHHHADLFSVIDDLGEFDALVVDPPKIVGSSDIYSKYFGALNRAIGGPVVEFQKWNKSEYLEYMARVVQIPSELVIFCYTSDTKPTPEEMQAMITSVAGEIVHTETILHGKRYDYAYVVRR